jgi:hypothetical protein
MLNLFGVKVLLAFVLVGAVSVGAIAQTPPQTTTAPAARPRTATDPAMAGRPIVVAGLESGGGSDIKLLVNKSRVVTTSRPYRRISVGQPDIIEANAIGPTKILVTAKKPGSTQLIIWDEHDESQMIDVLVQGAHVDVISTLRRGEETVARTIVENVKVTAVGRRLVRDPRETGDNAVRTVTLVMSPKNAEAIELASTNGRPRLVLRGSSDNSPTASPGVSLAELVGGVQNVAAPAPDAFGPAQQPVSDDGFAMAQPASEKTPTTKPAGTEGNPTGFIRRPVQIIRGGTESTIYYEMRVPPTRNTTSQAN